jgi:Domain of unknown function (DUF4360)
MKLSSLVISTLFLTVSANAAGSGIGIGEIEYGGTGCAVGTVSIEHDDMQISSIKFHDFKLSVRKGIERKACNLAIPLQVPDGVQVGFGPVDEINGFHSLPNTATKLTVNQEVFLSGSRGKVIQFAKNGQAIGALKIENESTLKNLKWSSCGQSTNLRVNLTANLSSNSRKLAFVALENLNITKSGRLYWRQCE